MIDDATLQKFLEGLNAVNEVVEVQINDGIGELYVNNPPRNYLTKKVMQELMLLSTTFYTGEKADKFSLRGLIITSSVKRTFSAGASLDMLGSVEDKEAQDEIRQLGFDLTTSIENLTLPVIAAINGICLGAGLEAALACHYRICARGAHLGLPEVLLNFMPGVGGTQRLPRLIGKGKALHLILSGKLVTADEAYELGFVDKVVEKKDLMSEARKVAREMCSQDIKASRSIVEAVNAAFKLPLEEGLNLESDLFWDLVSDRIKAGGISDADVKKDFMKKKE